MTERKSDEQNVHNGPLTANPLDIHSQYERQIKDLQEAYGEAMLELRARKKLQSLLDEAEK